MNKKNFPIFISVLITSLFFTMIFYFVYTGLQDRYKGIRQASFADASLDVGLSASDIEKLEGIGGIQIAGGLSEQRESALFHESMIVLNFQDRGINAMREYSNLLEGRFAENPEEIVVSKNLAEKYGLDLGESLSLSVGRRHLGNQEIHPTSTYTQRESFKAQEEKLYKIVGIHGDVYNKYLNLSFAMTLPGENAVLRTYLRFEDFKEAYRNQDKIKNEIEKRLGRQVEIEFSKTLIHYYRVGDTGIAAVIPMMASLSSILFTALLFVFFIRNIFKIWGFRKIRELSMYKSIGTTDLQIYFLLMKEAVLISILPIAAGHGAGYLIMNGIYRKIQEIKMADKILSMGFSPAPSMAALAAALLILMAAVISPARAISKIDIIDGIRGNFYSKNRKRKKNVNLWKELRDNNRVSLRSLRCITAVGTIIISCFLITVGISDYYYDLFFYESAYNIHVIYNSTAQETPEALKEILDHLPKDRAYISRGKYFNVKPDLEFSKEAEEKGIRDWLKENLKRGEEERIEGRLIGLEEEQLRKLGGKKGEFLLRNLLQDDPRAPLSKARYIPYLKDPSELTVYLSGGEPGRKIKISGTTLSTGEIEEVLRPMEIQIFTDLKTQRSLIENHEKAKEARAGFELKAKVEDSDLEAAREYIADTIKAGSSLDYRFTIVTGGEIAEDQALDRKAYLLVICGIGLVILLLNLTNGYASIHMSLLHRKGEIGSLYSCGMEKGELKRLYLREFVSEKFKSLGITAAVSLFVMTAVSLFSKTLSMQLLLAYYPWLFFAVFAGLVYGMNILLYYLALNSLLKQPAIELIRNE